MRVWVAKSIRKDPLNTCQYAVQCRDLDENPDCDLESGKFGTTLHLPRDFCVKDDSGFEDTLKMERGGDVGAFCWIRPSANHIQICVVCCIVPLSSRKLSSQNLSGAFGFPTTSHHSSSAETKEKTKETVSAGV